MKTLKINYSKTIINLSLALLLVSYSCKSSGNETKSNPTDLKEVAVQKETPSVDIQTAILTDNVEVVKQHLASETDINKKDAMTGATPLITAATFGKKEMVQLLLSANADLSVTNNDNATALHTAAFFCEVEIVQLLIDANADKTIKNNFGATPRESVMGPFEQVKPIYKMLQQQLSPMGLNIDLDYIEKTRPVIAEMLK